LAGRSVTQTRKHYVTYANHQAGKKKGQVTSFKTKLEYLSIFRTCLDHVLRGPFAYSAEETERRQNLGGGLCHVTDEVFQFYLVLEIERQKLHTLERAHLLKSQVLSDSSAQLRANNAVIESFTNIFLDIENKDDAIIQEMFNDLFDSYIRVANNEFRKSLSAALGKKRKLQHRVEIYRSKATKKSEGILLPSTSKSPAIQSCNTNEPNASQVEKDVLDS
jgi:hypothetical protein